MIDNEIKKDDLDLDLDFSDLPDVNLDDVQVEEQNDAEVVGMNFSQDEDVFDGLIDTMMPEKNTDAENISEENVGIDEEDIDGEQSMDTNDEAFSENVNDDNESSYLPEGLMSEPNFIAWYSGNADDPIFEVSKNSESGFLEGDDVWRTVHVNVGNETYGWQVKFSDGTYMGIDDVREYQLRKGALPSSEGTIIYGPMRIEFKNIERITVYQSVRYFTYA